MPASAGLTSPHLLGGSLWRTASPWQAPWVKGSLLGNTMILSIGARVGRSQLIFLACLSSATLKSTISKTPSGVHCVEGDGWKRKCSSHRLTTAGGCIPSREAWTCFGLFTFLKPMGAVTGQARNDSMGQYQGLPPPDKENASQACPFLTVQSQQCCGLFCG